MSRQMFIILSVKLDGLPLATQHLLHSTLEIKSLYYEKNLWNTAAKVSSTVVMWTQKL